MQIRLLLLVLALPVCLYAEDLVIGSTTYKNYEVVKVEPDGLRILHSAGAAKIPYEQLPATLLKQYSFDPAKAKEFRERKAGDQKAAEEKRAADEKAAADKTAAEKAAMDKKAAEKKEVVAKEANPLGWEDIPADPAKAQQGKVWGIADVQAKMYELNGKIIRVEVIANSASTMESIDKGSFRMFAGTIFKKDSNYEFIGFPAEAENKVRVMLKSSTGKMSFYVRVEAENRWPYPQLWVVGRSIHQGGLGTPPRFQW